MHWNRTRYWGKGSVFHQESTVDTAVQLFHLMDKAGIFPTLQQELGKDLINRKIWQENSVQGRWTRESRELHSSPAQFEVCLPTKSKFAVFLILVIVGIIINNTCRGKVHILVQESWLQKGASRNESLDTVQWKKIAFTVLHNPTGFYEFYRTANSVSHPQTKTGSSSMK